MLKYRIKTALAKTRRPVRNDYVHYLMLVNVGFLHTHTDDVTLTYIIAQIHSSPKWQNVYI